MTEAKTILVVEDERIIAMDLQRRLQSFGYQVPVTADTAEGAIRCASERCPDLVLLDIRIRGELDGIEAAALLRQRFDVPVVYLTAYADPETVARAKATSPYGYLMKPVKLHELRVAVELALHKHELERRLRERERWFSTTLRAIGDAVVATNSAGEITFMNLAAEQLTETRERDAIGRRLTEVVQLVDENTRAPIADPLERALVEQRVVGLDGPTTLVTGTGERPIEDSAAPIVDDTGALLGAVLVFRDTTDQRRMQQQIAMADRLSSLGTLVAGVAHEVNNPLAVMMASADLGREELRLIRRHPDAASFAEALANVSASLDDVLQQAERIRSLVADLSAFSRPQSDVGGVVDLRGAIDLAVRMTEPATRRVCRLEWTAPAELPSVRGTELRLSQVFVNLILNAVHAIEDRPGFAGHRIRVWARSAGERVEIGVEDTGAGIRPEILPRLFEPFFTTKPVGRGSGLGLSVVHGIVTALGGQVTVDTAVGLGSTFVVSLPAEGAAEPAGPASEPARRGRILVVDDEPLMLRAIRRILVADHDVVTVEEPEAALAMLESDPAFDLVLCDLMMSRIPGMELYARTTALRPELAPRFVFVTGGALTQAAADFLARLPNPTLFKPFGPQELLALVRANLPA